MICVDTDVMIDILRHYAPTLDWLRSLGSEELAIPGLVAMELLQGCCNRREQQRVKRVLRPYRLSWPSQSDCERAFNHYAKFHLSHQLGILGSWRVRKLRCRSSLPQELIVRVSP
jgi:predicted nucleic acid-binding protein